MPPLFRHINGVNMKKNKVNEKFYYDDWIILYENIQN